MTSIIVDAFSHILHRSAGGVRLLTVLLLLHLPAAPAAAGGDQTGTASYYSWRFHGRTTASGEPFDKEAMTAAHRTLPFGTLVRVHNQRNGRSVVLRINDRGPYLPGRIIDLSLGAARVLGMVRAGKTKVRLEVLDAPAGLKNEPSGGERKIR